MKNIWKKLLALGLVGALTLSMAACTAGGGSTENGDNNEESAPVQNDDAEKENDAGNSAAGATEEQNAAAGGTKIGVAMPTKDLQRWNQDGENVKNQLEAAGYEVDLQFANNEEETQVSQLENMITGGCNLLVVAAINGETLSDVLDKAGAAGIPVIAYDRLIMNTDAITYYATFDNEKVGTIQGEYIRDALDLENTDGPYNIELFTGSSDDNNVNFFFGGAMSILQPYIDEGKLVIQSGTDATVAACATPQWSSEESQKRMDNIITKSYSDGTELHAVLSSNDSVANGITNALVNAGYTADNFPVLTGQDCDITAVQNILKGLQSMSIFKDTRTLAAKTVEMVDAIMSGEDPEINDSESYDNGTGVIPTYLCDPVFADQDNYQELLIESGYYTEDELQ